MTSSIGLPRRGVPTPDAQVMWATVTNVTPLKIRADRSATDTPALALPHATAFAVGDRVAYVRLEPTLLVLGKPA